jgi:putative addiction module component (TIGR02574 family)
VAKTANDLRDEALKLSTQDRARLASDLLASIDSDTVDAAEIDRLSIETQRRAKMLESGDAGVVSWDEVEQRFAERRTQRRT